MIVTDLNQMESIVSRSRDLIWDTSTHGYDVLKIRWSPTAFFYKDGRRINGKWYRTKRIQLTRKGWLIPDDQTT